MMECLKSPQATWLELPLEMQQKHVIGSMYRYPALTSCDHHLLPPFLLDQRIRKSGAPYAACTFQLGEFASLPCCCDHTTRLLAQFFTDVAMAIWFLEQVSWLQMQHSDPPDCALLQHSHVDILQIKLHCSCKEQMHVNLI